MELHEANKGPEATASDKDLNALEAWVLGSSHYAPSEKGDEQPIEVGNLPSLLKNDRKLVLTPENVLRGLSVEDENAIRTRKPYEDGMLALFGAGFMFSGFKHKIYLGELDTEGIATTMEIELLKNGEVVDPQSLNLEMEESFTLLFEKPTIENGRISLRVLHL